MRQRFFIFDSRLNKPMINQSTFASRRAEFMSRLLPHSTAIIAGAHEVIRGRDTAYRFRQDADFFYLTGFNEPDAIAVFNPSSTNQQFVLFVRPHDPSHEKWTGWRAGVEGAKNHYGADAAYSTEEFNTQLGELIKGSLNLYFQLGIDIKLDNVINSKIASMRPLSRRGIFCPQTIHGFDDTLHEMRLFKSEEEIRIIARAAEISSEAHCEAMKHACKVSSEYEIEALIEYIFRKNGAAMPSYGSIIGGGKNATVLHYTDNNAPLVSGELLLVDAGAEFESYAADITRTFPITGRFSEPQRKIYEAVLDVQMKCIEKVRPGIRYREINDLATRLLTEHLVKLRLLEGDVDTLIQEEKQKEFYMHGIGHFLGMDVHDVGSYVDLQDFTESRKLEAGMVLTIEPGLYIDHNSSSAEYKGIGVRIEDDVLITKNGNRVLTSGAPKTIEEIEKLMA